ncbi:hypothetical protein HD596_010144 [Nonomuraea jabiensis]|uniref:Uncharacterized protein n=1 Tax=Nonomuraea jabiensis TaxID=882448 RepID=A0A7W9LH02_9ACTN|nr:hypothetical protein [Nonomuraea jabiensis]
MAVTAARLDGYRAAIEATGLSWADVPDAAYLGWDVSPPP